MHDIFLTVSIPCYNGEKTLSRCVESILAQSYNNFELLIIDDGSVDSTPAIADDFCKVDSRVRVIHQMNRGLSASRNRAIRESKGVYISFIDADDTICSDYLKNLLEAVLKYDADLAVCKYYTQKKKGIDQGNHVISQDLMFKEMLVPSQNIAAFAWNRMYKVELIKTYNLQYDEAIYGNEDALFNFQYLEKCGTVAVVEKELYHYIINTNSIMFSKGFNPKRLLANHAFQYMLRESKGKNYYHDVQVSAMWYNLILKRRIILSRAKIDENSMKEINEMLRMNPNAFMKASIPLKYKLAYPFWRMI